MHSALLAELMRLGNYFDVLSVGRAESMLARAPLASFIIWQSKGKGPLVVSYVASLREFTAEASPLFPTAQQPPSSSSQAVQRQVLVFHSDLDVSPDGLGVAWAGTEDFLGLAAFLAAHAGLLTQAWRPGPGAREPSPAPAILPCA